MKENQDTQAKNAAWDYYHPKQEPSDIERTFKIEVWMRDRNYPTHTVEGVTNLYEAVSEILNALQLLYPDSDYRSACIKLTW